MLGQCIVPVDRLARLKGQTVAVMSLTAALGRRAGFVRRSFRL
jgi:hypothetical protein